MGFASLSRRADRRRALLGVLAGLAVGAAAMNPGGAGAAEREHADLAPFTRVQFDIPADFRLRIAARGRVRLSAAPEVIERISVAVEGNTLVVRARKPFQTREPVEVQVEAPRYEQIVLNGAASVHATGLQDAPLAVRLAGSGDFRAERLNLPSLRLDLAGSGDVELSGSAQQQTVRIEGSGNYRAAALRSETASVTIQGAADAEVTVSRQLEVRIEGAGTVRYGGEPKLTQHIAGAGSVEKL